MTLVGRELKEKHRWKCPWEECDVEKEIPGSFWDARNWLVAHIFAEHDEDVYLSDEEFEKCIDEIDVDIKETSGS